MQPEVVDSYQAIFAQELKNILSYWETYALDHERGGFYGGVDQHNQPMLTADKSCVLNARILWTFAAASKIDMEISYREMAQRAYNVLVNNFVDGYNGGYYTALNPASGTANENKHTYFHAFVLYAFSQYYLLKPTKELSRRIQDLFRLFEEKMLDPIGHGYLESFQPNWQIDPQNHIAAHNEPKTMNTHLHILEAFTALYRVWPAPLLQRRLREVLLIFLNNILREDGHLGSYFDRGFKETKSSLPVLTFGHDIEASWLLWEAAEVLGDGQLVERTRQASQKLLEAVIRDGIADDGGLYLESHYHGRKMEPVRYYWTQAEALVGFMNGYQLTGDEKYWARAQQTWDFINDHYIDHELGEWFTRIDLQGRPIRLKTDTAHNQTQNQDWKIHYWKGPYHHGRACIEMIDRLAKIN